MPLLRYFTFVGGALFALLFVVSPFIPKAETVSHPDTARPVIRISSDKVGPPRVEFDTRRQTTVVAIPAMPVPEVQPQPTIRQAEARFVGPLPAPAAPVKVERKTTRVAKRPDHQRMAAYPMWFQPLRLTW
jgi:hypothetical protein